MRRVIIAGLIACAGCSSNPKPGDSCTIGVCRDAATALFCELGKLEAIPCRGPAGCTNANAVQCDLSGDHAGDPCPQEAEGQAVCDGSAANVAAMCVAGSFVAFPCQSACTVVSGSAQCTLEPGPKGECATCASDADCGPGGFCAAVPGGNGSCTAPCTESAACIDPGSTCYHVGQGSDTGCVHTGPTCAGTIGPIGSCTQCDPSARPTSCPTGSTCVAARPGATLGLCAEACDASGLTCGSSTSTCVLIGTQSLVCYPWACLGLGGPGTPAHEPWPQVPDQHGPVLASPEMVPITFNPWSANGQTTSYPYQSEMEAYAQTLMEGSYVPQMGQEYGVGHGSSGQPVRVSDAPPAEEDDAQLQTYLATLISRGTLPAPGAGTVYVFYVPSTTAFYKDPVTHQAQLCAAVVGYHNSFVSQGQVVIYAVIGDCGASAALGTTALQSLQMATSHELAEAATDPQVLANPAWELPQDPSNPWATGGEIGDMCFGILGALDQSGDIFQREWSNAQATIGASPCLPASALGTFVTISSLPYMAVGHPSTAVTVPLLAWSPQAVTSVPFNIVGSGPVNVSSVPTLTAGTLAPLTINLTGSGAALLKLYPTVPNADNMFWPLQIGIQ